MNIRTLLPVTQAGVKIRPLTHSDAAAYANGSHDTDVRRFAHLPEPHYTPALVSEQIDSIITPGLIAGNLAVLAIADNSSDQFLGSVVLFDIADNRAEIGFWLAAAARGRGAAHQAVECVAELGTRMGLRELHARTVNDNTTSVRTLTNADFAPHGNAEIGTAPSGEQALLQHYTRSL
ncbi:GNAT family N-acetyltransferase [Allosaccharopolyspora coralli]|uniref:GNAT family N-acetyltransferase n=1 Tax=Allosaccharopolyspora coralli TaxID=2665642 RepID=UPI001652A3CC|nr:GNAT family N-acetyltransferase [Allosaccharopolyspora coralli]